MVEEFDYDDINDLDNDPRYSDDPDVRGSYYLDELTSRIDNFLTELGDSARSAGDEVRAVLDSPKNFVIASSRIMKTYLQNSSDAEFRARHNALYLRLVEHCHSLGFRFGSQLMTPSEHERIGSTVWIRYGELDPELPTQIAHGILIDQGALEDTEEQRAQVMTIEEVDRARRLQGMTALDPKTGHITDEKDLEAAGDKFHFIPIEHRPDFLAEEASIIAGYEDLAMNVLAIVESMRSIIGDLKAFYEGRMPMMQLLMNVDHFKRTFPSGYSISQLDELCLAATELGRFDKYLTPQEILIRCGGAVDDRYLANPYVPIGVQDGLDVAQVTMFRQAMFSSLLVTSEIIGDYENRYRISLEPLNDEGATESGPRLLERENPYAYEADPWYEEYTSEENKQVKIPFARPGDWYYKI